MEGCGLSVLGLEECRAGSLPLRGAGLPGLGRAENLRGRPLCQKAHFEYSKTARLCQFTCAPAVGRGIELRLFEPTGVAGAASSSGRSRQAPNRPKLPGSRPGVFGGNRPAGLSVRKNVGSDRDVEPGDRQRTIQVIPPAKEPELRSRDPRQQPSLAQYIWSTPTESRAPGIPRGPTPISTSRGPAGIPYQNSEARFRVATRLRSRVAAGQKSPAPWLHRWAAGIGIPWSLHSLHAS
jgi:hypothetical protein